MKLLTLATVLLSAPFQASADTNLNTLLGCMNIIQSNLAYGYSSDYAGQRVVVDTETGLTTVFFSDMTLTSEYSVDATVSAKCVFETDSGKYVDGIFGGSYMKNPYENIKPSWRK